MPIYGYACTACEHRFNALQKMSDPKLSDCPECGESALQKQLSAPKFRLKGSGWYETDFKTGDQRNIAGDSDAKPAQESNSAEASSDKTSSDKTGSDKTGSDKKSGTTPAKKTETKTSSTDSKAKSA